jgi:hypothetical protein
LTALGKVRGPELAPGIRRVDPRLVEKLELVADHFHKTGQPAHIVLAPGASFSQPTGSHRSMARSIDFRIESVSGEALASFCKTLPDAACESSPRGTFVRLELRSSDAGHAADGGPAASTERTPSTPALAPAEPGGKLAPLPGMDRPATAGSLKTGDSQRFL